MKTKSLTISILILAVVAYVTFLLMNKKVDLDSDPNPITATEEDVQSGPKRENLREVIDTLGKEGYYNNWTSNQLGLGFLVEDTTGAKLGVSPFYNKEKDSTRYYLNETGTYEIYDDMEISNPYHDCLLNGAKNYSPIIVSYVGEFPDNFDNFKIEKAYSVDFDSKQFIEIDSSNVTCFAPFKE